MVGSPLPEAAPPGYVAGAGTMMELTGGRIMIQGGGVEDCRSNHGAGDESVVPTHPGFKRQLRQWELDNRRVDDRDTPLYYASNVLPSGQVFVLGGESGSSPTSNTGENYDTTAGTWTPIPNNFPQTGFADDPTMLLPPDGQHPDGSVLAGYFGGPQTYLYDIGTQTWSPTGVKAHEDSSERKVGFSYRTTACCPTTFWLATCRRFRPIRSTAVCPVHRTVD